MTYYKTAEKTAKINGITPVSSKIIVDFSELKNAVNATMDNTIFDLDTVYAAAVNELINSFNNHCTSGNFDYASIYVNGWKIDVDVSFNVINVYDSDGYKRKYKHIIVDAVRITIYGKYGNVVSTYTYNDKKFKTTHRTPEDAYIT